MSEDPHQHIARLIDEAQPIGADDTDEVVDVEATTQAGDGGDTPVPRAWGFDVPRMNREWALVLMGSKAVIVHEQSTGPIEDRVRVLTLDAFRAWFLNTRTEYIGPDG
ncbi:hypothetical protein INQ30_24090, partial [Escherichia coli]|nr:hypothetical protein [Escherichia coli]